MTHEYASNKVKLEELVNEYNEQNHQINMLSKDEMYFNEQMEITKENQDDCTNDESGARMVSKIKETIDTLRLELKDLNIKCHV